MLKRNDLAKQFELVVQQEIKNYNDSLNMVLQKLRDLTDEIESVKQLHLENHALLHSIQGGMRTEIASHKEQITALKLHLKTLCSEHKCQSEVALRLISDLDAKIEDKVQLDAYYQHRLDENTVAITNAKVANFDLNARMTDHVSDLISRFSQGIENAKSEMLQMPSHLKEVEKSWAEKLECHRVDVAAIMQEIRMLQAALDYDDKKIEDLYMQIERLKKSGAIA